MKKTWIRKGLLLFSLCNVLAPFSSADGVGGVGNTTDLTIQFQLIKEVSARFLKNTSPYALYPVDRENKAALRKFFIACREPIYRGALKTKIEVRHSIPDTSGYHALARRLPGFITLISRTEIERLKARGEVNAHFLIHVFLHELAHDCHYNGSPVGDEMDDFVNQWVSDLIAFHSQSRVLNAKDIDFVDRVHSGQEVTIEHLSPQSLEKINTALLNYTGDWLYKTYQKLFSFRPAPASDFYANAQTSVFPGWNELEQITSHTNRELRFIAGSLLRASFESQKPSYYDNFERKIMPSSMTCTKRQDPLEKLYTAHCHLKISWHKLPVFSSQITEAQFTLDALGRLNVQSIHIK